MSWEYILLDQECQRDFFTPGGSCYKRYASSAAAKVYDLFRWAVKYRVPVISTVLRVSAGRVGPLANVPHCVDGSDGERKLARTVLSSRLNFGLRNSTDLPEDVFDQYRQVIFEKRRTDIFQHARLERLITQLPLCTFVLCGAGVAEGIAQAAIGLRMRGFRVFVASDAVLDLDDPLADMAERRMAAKGALLLPTEHILKRCVREKRTRRRTTAQKPKAVLN